MAFQVETTADIDPLTDALLTAIETQTVTEDGLHELRHLLCRSSPLSSAQIDLIVDAHRRMPADDGLWIEFFLEALTDVFLTRRGDRIYLAARAEDRLFEIIGDGDPITDIGFRHLVLRLLFRATDVSERFRNAVLTLVHHHLMHDDQRLLIDLPRQAGTIDIVDLQLVRKLAFGAGGQYDRPIERSVADFLLLLDQGAFTVIEKEAWHRLFIKAMTRHLLGPPILEEQAVDEIDEDASQWLVEQINAGRSGRTMAALIQHLIDQGPCLPPSLQTSAANIK